MRVWTPINGSPFRTIYELLRFICRVIFAENDDEKKREPCPEAHADSAPIVEKCDDKNKKGGARR